ncbi:unnamed protein product [Lathyrus sativus]|nr:unnamed protein product [Lathyrus sativus]
MSIMINESATIDFKVSKGLRQVDPLSPFLFILVMEVLTQLLKKSKSSDLYKGFKVSSDISYNLVQFGDDTLLIEEEN